MGYWVARAAAEDQEFKKGIVVVVQDIEDISGDAIVTLGPEFSSLVKALPGAPHFTTAEPSAQAEDRWQDTRCFSACE